MARPLSYTPPRVDHAPGHAQVDDFVAALDSSGLLRALTGAIRAHPELAAQVVAHVDTDDAQSLAALAGLMRVPEPDGARRFVHGARAARVAADEALTADTAPSMVDLVRRLADADVRRGLGALLAGLRAFGASMAPGRGTGDP